MDLGEGYVALRDALMKRPMYLASYPDPLDKGLGWLRDPSPATDVVISSCPPDKP